MNLDMTNVHEPQNMTIEFIIQNLALKAHDSMTKNRNLTFSVCKCMSFVHMKVGQPSLLGATIHLGRQQGLWGILLHNIGPTTTKQQQCLTCLNPKTLSKLSATQHARHRNNPSETHAPYLTIHLWYHPITLAPAL